MPDEISDAAMPDNPDDGWNIPAFLLMTGGVLPVMFASSLGLPWYITTPAADA